MKNKIILFLLGLTSFGFAQEVDTTFVAIDSTIVDTVEVTFDKNGELKTKDLFLDKPLNEQFTALVKPLHTGEIMGLPSIILYFIVCLIGCSLPVTGIVIWWHRLQKQKV